MLRFTSDLDPSIQLAFTTQAEGNLALHVNDDPSLVEANRTMLEERIGVSRFSLAFMNQVHSADVVQVEPGQRTSWSDPAAPTCDGLLSFGAATPLAVMVADCLPVLFVARHAEGQLATAAVHAGRRGLLDGILGVTVERLHQWGAEEIEAVIGPAICGSCYEVPEHMQLESESLMPGISSQTRWGSAGLDLPGTARRYLESLDVSVRSHQPCTLEDERFYSYRRDSACGRLAGVVWRR
ncbi:polyphenol oxidase family protein [Glutamicibacter endophyticus]|uniref:polyphenol oxidase family protein n=1 Tax=Glutamicibacter endophyticus TaxID=1522174 RepID=UPI003AF0CFB5